MKTKQILLAIALLVSPCLTQKSLAQENSPATDLERVKAGSPPPDFLLKDVQGKTHSLKDYEKKKNIVLVFYRGHW